MKKILLFLTISFALTNTGMNAQTILAGVHGVHDYYNDITPDKSIHAITIPGSNIDTFLLDINNDNVNDVKLTAVNDDFGNWYHYEYCTITPLNNNLIAIAGFDSCFANCPPPSFLYQIAMVDSLKLNDSINNHKNWIDSLAYLDWTGWNASYPNGCGYSCSHNTFSSDSKYIGVAVSVTAGTLYGWIKVKGVDYNSLIIEEYACNLIATEIESYKNQFKISISPNPFSLQTTLQSESVFVNATLLVYNVYGQTVKQIKNISGQTVTLYRDNLPSGLYFLSLIQDNKVLSTGKLEIIDY